jgi:hypothetical protein
MDGATITIERQSDVSLARNGTDICVVAGFTVELQVTGAPGIPGSANSLPPGGTAHQVLTKQSSTAGDAAWADVDDLFF